MYITKPITKKDKLYSTSQHRYAVICNTKFENYDEIVELKEEHLPNYLIVNIETRAIEFAIDQLPAAIQVANKLELELIQLINGFDPDDIEVSSKRLLTQ